MAFLGTLSIPNDIGDPGPGGSPIITLSPSSKIECNAQFLHQSEEDNLRRHLKKVLKPTESPSFNPSNKSKVLLRHVIKIAGITAGILFVVVMTELLALAENRPLTFSGIIIGAASAALIASIIEALIIAREHIR